MKTKYVLFALKNMFFDIVKIVTVIASIIGIALVGSLYPTVAISGVAAAIFAIILGLRFRDHYNKAAKNDDEKVD